MKITMNGFSLLGFCAFFSLLVGVGSAIGKDNNRPPTPPPQISSPAVMSEEISEDKPPVPPPSRDVSETVSDEIPRATLPERPASILKKEPGRIRQLKKHPPQHD